MYISNGILMFFAVFSRIFRVTKCRLIPKKNTKMKNILRKIFYFLSQNPPYTTKKDTLGHEKNVKYFVSGGKNENIPPKHFILVGISTSRFLDFVLTSWQDSLAQISNRSITHRWTPPPRVLQIRPQELSLHLTSLLHRAPLDLFLQTRRWMPC